MTKTIVSVGLLAFVGVSLVLSVADVAGWKRGTPTDNVMTAPSDGTKLAKTATTASPWRAYFFHAAHRCPTCRTIEQYAHEALQPDIEQGRINWQVADYTDEANQPLVKQFKVMTSTVVLAHTEGDRITRWQNFEEVWEHTSDHDDFHAFMQEAWNGFQRE